MLPLSKRKLPSRTKRIQTLNNHELRIQNLEKAFNQQLQVTHNQALVIAETVYGIQLLIKKGIITREELEDVKASLINPDSVVSPTSSVQPEDTGTDGDNSGSGEPVVSGDSSDRGDSDSNLIEGGSGDISPESEQSDSDIVSGEAPCK